MDRNIRIIAYEIEAFNRQVRGSLPGNVLHIADVSAVGIRIIGRLAVFILPIGTAAHVVHLVAAIRNGSLADGNRLIASLASFVNRKAIRIHHCITGGNAVQVRQVFGQLYFQFAVRRTLHGDILIRQCTCCTTDDIQLFVQFLGDNCIVIPLEFQAVFSSSQRVVLAVFPILAVIIDNAGDGFTVFAIDARFTLDDMDTSIGTVFAIFTILND